MYELKKNIKLPKNYVPGIYGLYNEDTCEWIYIGKAKDIFKRIKKHQYEIFNFNSNANSIYQKETYRKIRALKHNSLCNWYILKNMKGSSDKEMFKMERKFINIHKPMGNSC